VRRPARGVVPRGPGLVPSLGVTNDAKETITG
jgi:hypothetical protein